MSVEYILGVIVGVALSVIVIAVIYRLIQGTWRFKRCQFDERQQRARGIAYRNGFWTIIGCQFLWYCLLAAEAPILSGEKMVVLSLVAGLVVFGVSCVMLDAYLGLRDNPSRIVLILAVILGSNLICAGVNLCTNGINGPWWMNLACAIAMTFMLLAMGVKSLMRRGEDGEEEE